MFWGDFPFEMYPQLWKLKDFMYASREPVTDRRNPKKNRMSKSTKESGFTRGNVVIFHQEQNIFQISCFHVVLVFRGVMKGMQRNGKQKGHWPKPWKSSRPLK